MNMCKIESVDCMSARFNFVLGSRSTNVHGAAKGLNIEHPPSFEHGTSKECCGS